MKIFLHIGPHKTGTTSIQAYLLDRLGRRRPKRPVWYPAPREMGPGHARLAAQLNNGPAPSRPNALERIIEQAEAASVEALILSSEDFIGGFPNRLSEYGEPLAGHDVFLISTQNPVSRRIASMWQENIKHGHFETLADVPEIVFKRRGIRPGVLTAFAKALQPHQIAIVHSDPRDPPHALIDRFLAALGLPPDARSANAVVRHNPSLGLIEVEILRSLNRLLATQAQGISLEASRALRKTLISTFRSADWQASCPPIAIPVPENVLEAGRSLALRLTAEIASLEDHWDVKVFGDPEVLSL